MTEARQYEQNLVCFQTLGRAQPASLKTYRETGGYTALERAASSIARPAS